MQEKIAHDLRLEDFERRKQSDPSGLSLVDEYGWEYIAVHPMSDEIDVLNRLGIKPADCVAVDCYWAVGGDVVLLQVYGSGFLNGREPGFYAQWWSKNTPRLTLSAYLVEPSISRADVEQVMRKFFLLDLKSECFSESQLSDQLTLISH